MMCCLSDYDLIIFDCDGVVLDTNRLKIESMKTALRTEPVFTSELVDECIHYFSVNFGKSRYHHVEVFLDLLPQLTESVRGELRARILAAFAGACEAGYPKAGFTQGFRRMLSRLHSQVLFVASGSDQRELREVLRKKEISERFSGVFGAPTPKTEIVTEVLTRHPIGRKLLIGDSKFDYEAAAANDVEFAFYAPYSLQRGTMEVLSAAEHFDVIESWDSPGLS